MERIKRISAILVLCTLLCLPELHAQIGKSPGRSGFSLPKIGQMAGKQFRSKRKLIDMGLIKRESGPKRVKQQAAANGYMPKEIYAYSMYDEVVYEPTIVKLNMETMMLERVDGLSEIDYYPYIASGAYGDGKYYYYGGDDFGYPYFFASVDFETGERKLLNDYNVTPQVIVNDMSYDYSTSTMYAVADESEEASSSVLLKVNTETGNMEKVTNLDRRYLTMAIKYNGEMYAISDAGDLCSVDKSTGASTVLFNTGFEPEYTQSMDFDHTTETLWWAACDYSMSTSLVRIDIDSKTVDNLGGVGSYAQISGLYVPFTKKNLNAPAAPENLKLTPAAEGANSVTIEWTNPTKNIEGGDLTELSGVNIYRDGTLLTTVGDAKPGAAMSYVDNTVGSGVITYTVIAVNGSGEGMDVKDSTFVGRDAPGAVSSLAATLNGANSVTLNWGEPDAGVHNGWYDRDNVTYSVFRYPDSVCVAKEIKQTTFTDADVENLNNYFYRVSATTSDGTGPVATTDTLRIGTASFLPYSTSFSTYDQNLWTIIDGNDDGKTWNYNLMIGKYWFDNDESDAVIYFGNATETTDDWLVSSPIRFNGGKSYTLLFNKRISRKGETATMDIAVGTGDDPKRYKVMYTLDFDNFVSDRFSLALPDISGDERVALHLTNAVDARVQVKDFTVEQSEDSRVEGVVSANGAPVAGAYVALADDQGAVLLSDTTDVNGQYILPCVAKGTYSLTVSHPDYTSRTEQLSIDEAGLQTKNISMTSADKFALSGKIVDEKGNPLSQVAVSATNGNVRLATSTDAEGAFTLKDVVPGDYTVEYFKNSYEQITEQMTVGADRNDINITMIRKVLSPTNVSATDGNVTWSEPVEHKELRYDDGTLDGEPFGFSGGTMYSVIGTIFRQPSVPVSVSWYTVNDGYDDHDLVNLFIFDVEPDGTPTNKILFEQSGIQNTPGSWTTFKLPENINCPNGFVAALSVDGGFLSLGCDDGEGDDYPFREKTYCSTDNYETNGFYYLEENGYRKNFMIRADVVPTGAALNVPAADTQAAKNAMALHNDTTADKTAKLQVRKPLRQPAPTESATGAVYPAYNVYRVAAGQESDEAQWKQLNTTPIEAFSLKDTEWASLPQGYYSYAVKAVYTDNRLSDAAMSERYGKDVTTDVEVAVSVDKIADAQLNGYVTIAGEDTTFRADLADGKAMFKGIMKGNYTMNVVAAGCKPYSAELDLTADNRYTENVTLEEDRVMPFNLKVENDKSNASVLSWNTVSLSDDFEGHQAFTINSPGEIGWNYIDGDQSGTAAFFDSETSESYEYPGMFEKMAFIVFNPSATNPPMKGDELKAHSGNQSIAALSSLKQNDDYFISPLLAGTDNLKFSFYANSIMGLDSIAVGYSATGMEEKDFVWVADKILVADGWNLYSYDIPAGARYVAVRCFSNRATALLIDDVTIESGDYATAQSEGIGAHNYEVYLDGNLLTTQPQTTYNFGQLQSGSHTASVKAIYESGESELSSIEFDNSTSGITNATSNVKLSVADGRLTVTGDFTVAEVYTTAGVNIATLTAASSTSNRLKPDVYMVRINSNGAVRTYKVVVGR